MKSLYLLVGDTFLVDEKVADLLKEAAKETSGEIVKQSYYLADTELGEILTTARTLPFLVEKQIFIIHQADKLKKADQETLLPYFEKQNPQTILIFICGSLDRRGGLDKFFVKCGGEFVLFDDKQKQGMATRYIREKLKQFDKRMDGRVQKRLEELTGDAPAFLDSILNQLILYVDDREVITEDDFAHFEEKISSIDVFQLMNAIASRNIAQALRLYNQYMEETGTDFFSLLGLLHWQMRRLWKARIMLDEGATSQMVGKQCRISPRQMSFFTKQVNAFSREKLDRAIDGLFELDIAIKTGQMDQHLGMERWLVETSA